MEIEEMKQKTIHYSSLNLECWLRKFEDPSEKNKIKS